MGLLQPESGLLFWMLLSFIVVFVILAKYGFPVITKMVEERRVFVEKSLEAAKEAKAQLDNIKTESEALLQQAMLSVDIAEKVIRNKLDNTPAQMSMIDRLLEEMPDMKQS